MKSAVSVYCRLGFARKKNSDLDANLLHPTWNDLVSYSPQKSSLVNPDQPEEDPLLAELAAALAELGTVPNETEGSMNNLTITISNECCTKRMKLYIISKCMGTRRVDFETGVSPDNILDRLSEVTKQRICTVDLSAARIRSMLTSSQTHQAFIYM